MVQALITRLSSNAFIRGSLVFTITSFIVSVLNYLFNLLIARGFSLSDYGEYMSAFSYFAVLSVPFSALSVIIINRISRTKVSQRVAVAAGIEQWIIRLLVTHKWLILLTTSLLFCFFYFKTNLLLSSIAFILISVVLNLFSIVYTSILQAYKTFLVAGLFGLSIAVIKLLFGTSVTVLFPQIEYLYLVLILLQVVTVVVGSKLLVFKQAKVDKPVVFDSIQTYIFKKQIIIPTLTMLGIIGMLNMDLILVKKFFDPGQAGLYAGLSLLGKIILYATGPLSLVALTFFAGTEHTHNKKKILLFSILLYILIGGFVCLLYYSFSELVVQVVFGAKFSEISNYVWLTAVFGSLYSIMSLLGQYAISKLSHFGVYSLLGLALQIIGLYFFHESFYDVLGVNIVVMLSMTAIYSVCIIRNAK